MKYILETIVFTAGAVVMVLELTGSRILAPFVGSSLYVWTSLIGIILGSLSYGYWLGGKTADKYPTYKRFSFYLLLSGVLIGLTAILKTWILAFILNYISDIRFSSVIATIVLFTPASICLGMVSPYAVKLKIEDLASTGKTVGSLYALSTMGSIFGTFFAGFFLMAYVGSTNILYILALTMLLLSALAHLRSYIVLKSAVAVLLLISMSVAGAAKVQAEENGYFDFDTAYSKVIISEGIDSNTGKRVRRLKTSSEEVQSAMFLDSDELVFGYTKFYDLSKHIKPELDSALMIGGGAYSYPKSFLKEFENAKIDVVEIDPELTEFSKRYFNLKEDDRMRIIHEDGRVFLNKSQGKYDVIYMDAFNTRVPPPHLTTIEAVQLMHDSLEDDGFVIANTISALKGEKSKFLSAIYKTYSEVFEEVHIFPVHSKEEESSVQNIILLASKKSGILGRIPENEDTKFFLDQLWSGNLDDSLPIFTDEYAPVESYMLETSI